MNQAVLALGLFGQELVAILFLSLRIGAAMMAVPLFGLLTVPPQLRAFLSIAMAVFIASWIVPDTQGLPDPLSLIGLVAVAQELLIGFALGFVLQIAFAVPLVAAEQIGGTMGLAIATSVDPASGSQAGAIGQFMSLLLIFVFLAIGAHLLWLELIIESYRSLPPGDATFSAATASSLVAFGGLALATAAAMALPLVLILLLVQVAIGVLSRSAPALNLFALGLPTGVLVGLAGLIAALPMLTEQMESLARLGIEQAALVVRP